jgi:hypothetical protein
MTSAGPQVTSPSDFRNGLETLIQASNPGYTANLPGSLIEDILSTDIAALSVMDSARVDLVNSVSPYAANPYLLVQLGNIYGVPLGLGSNTSVYVVFSGTAGFTINAGFIVSDGNHSYVVQDGAIIGAGGTSDPIYCVAVDAGSWAVPNGTVTQLITSVPTGIVLTVTNPQDGLSATSAQTTAQYRSQVIQAGFASAQGMPTFLKTQLQKVTGVQQRLVSFRQVADKWQIICGGGDPYQVANAIFKGAFDLGSLVGSTINVTNVTSANPAVVTTDLNHGYVTGQTVQLSGVVGLNGVNNVNFTATVIDQKTFSINFNALAAGTYVSGGVVTPNLRNISVSINDFPDTYVIPFVNPPQQEVSIFVDWATISNNYVSPAAVSQLANAAIVTYINSIYAGQPISLYQIQCAFKDSIVNVLPSNLISTIEINIYIDGVQSLPQAGTGLVYGDPESYFFTQTSLITVNKA